MYYIPSLYSMLLSFFAILLFYAYQINCVILTFLNLMRSPLCSSALVCVTRSHDSLYDGSRRHSPDTQLGFEEMWAGDSLSTSINSSQVFCCKLFILAQNTLFIIFKDTCKDAMKIART